MCEISEGSFLTIAATSSPNCSSDLFNTPIPDIFDTSGHNSSGLPYQIFAREGISHPGITSKQDDIFKLWPLLNRAWVLQERLLALRVLHITTVELIWECRKQTRCECGIMNFDDDSGESQRWRGPYSKVSHYKTLHKVDQPSLIQIWHDIVQWYTKLSITYHSDRLPALSGLAKQMGSRRRVSYLAGLWEDSLPLDLLWKRHLGSPQSNTAKADKSQVAKAPSWSWGSSNKAIIFPLSNLNDNTLEKTYGSLKKIYPTSITTEVKPATLDPTGNVKNCSLSIKGRAFEAVVTG
ncbi:Fc.00g011290.m01.CDS01 [Cosmosporella sp. VM-42]